MNLVLCSDGVWRQGNHEKHRQDTEYKALPDPKEFVVPREYKRKSKQ